MIGNGKSLDITHIGHSYFPIPYVKSLHLKNILRVPKITKNLVNISKLTADNHIFMEFHSDFCLVKGKTTKNVLLRGRLKDGLYLLTEPQPTAASQNRKTPRPFTSNSNMSISNYHPNNSCNSVCCSMIVLMMIPMSGIEGLVIPLPEF